LFAFGKGSSFIAIVGSFFYGFLSVLFAGHHLVNFHPMTIGLAFIKYEASQYQYNYFIDFCILASVIILSLFILNSRFGKNNKYFKI